MSRSQEPWMKFYPQDWRADEKLRLCSLAARGLWIEMLAIMHRSERYGHLLIGGTVPTDVQLAVQAGASPEEVSALLRELSDAGVFSRAASGAIYSRRMTRDRKKAENARKNGKKGGNPNLRKTKENSGSVNLNSTQRINSEARSQKPEEAKASSACAREPEDVIALTARLCRASKITMPDPSIQFDRHRDFLSIVASWLDTGARPEKIEECVAARAASSGWKAKSLRYFDGAVRDAAQAQKQEITDAERMARSILQRTETQRRSEAA